MAITVSTGGSMAQAIDGRVLLHNVSWERYEGLLDLLGDDYPNLRLTYLEGTLEIMATSPEHELQKKVIARLLEMWAVERNVPLTGYGSATFRKRAKERGLEPDECYVIGRRLVDMPDLAIEVVYRHGGIDKLEVYVGLAIPEVWFWMEARLVVFHLVGERYERRDRSELLTGLDLEQLSAFVLRCDETNQTEIVREYRDALRAKA
jgi:Uma2 family endonuclease